MTQGPWTRRRVLQGLTVAAAARPLQLLAAPLLMTDAQRLYACMPHGTNGETALRVFRETHTGWSLQQHLPAAGATALAADSAGTSLYVAHASDNTRAHLRTYRVRRDGSLQAQAQQPLALAAHTPTGIAVSPAGTLMVVATAAGVYSLLPMLPDGTPAEVTAVRKEMRLGTGANAQTAMHFRGDDVLQVQDEHGVRCYRCTVDGMEPVALTAAAFLQDEASPIAGAHAFLRLPHRG